MKTKIKHITVNSNDAVCRFIEIYGNKVLFVVDRGSVDCYTLFYEEEVK